MGVPFSVWGIGSWLFFPAKLDERVDEFSVRTLTVLVQSDIKRGIKPDNL